MAPLLLALQKSAFARPLSARCKHAGGAWANIWFSVRRLAGKSASRLRGMMMFCPPTTMVPPDHGSVWLLSVRRSISPVIGAADAVCACAVPAGERKNANNARSIVQISVRAVPRLKLVGLTFMRILLLSLFMNATVLGGQNTLSHAEVRSF